MSGVVGDILEQSFFLLPSWRVVFVGSAEVVATGTVAIA